MAEEHKLQEPTTHVPCANNCGFFGSPTTLNLCAKCYKDHCLKEQQLSTAKIAVENSLINPPHQSETSVPESSPAFAGELVSMFTDESIAKEAEVDQGIMKPRPNRCSSCKKRVGLTGFTCKCGITFCGSHRYPEMHDCSFDFKTVGKEAIARENPVVKAAKLVKI